MIAKVIRDRFPPLARPTFPQGGIVDTGHIIRERENSSVINWETFSAYLWIPVLIDRH
jgi:hypothetical protein